MTRLINTLMVICLAAVFSFAAFTDFPIFIMGALWAFLVTKLIESLTYHPINTVHEPHKPPSFEEIQRLND